jgi:hypothetical protein
MAIEISNAIHAMALVTVDDSGRPLFVGQGNVGFAPFGTGPNFSEQVGPGRYRLHMLAPISIVTPNPTVGRGEGMVLAEPLQNAGPQFPIVPPLNQVFVGVSGLSDIVVETLSSPTKSFAGATAFAEVTDDTTIFSVGFVDLLTVPITVAQGGSGILDILATGSAQATLDGTQVNFQLTLDGTSIGPGAANGASFTVHKDGDKASIAIVKRVTGVAPGNHTVKLRWRVVGAEAEASIGISAAFEHGSLRVTEESIGESKGDENITFQVLVLRFPQQSTLPG